MKFVTLLCCISPSVDANDINELTFYKIITAVGPVKNIRLISNYGQVKAFIQIESAEVAQKIIDSLNGETLSVGKVKIFESHKKYVAFEKPLKQVLADALTGYKNSGSHLKVRHFNDSSDYNNKISLLNRELAEDYVDLADYMENYNRYNLKHCENSNINYQKYANYCKLAPIPKIRKTESMGTCSSTDRNATERTSGHSKWKTIRIDNLRSDRVSCQMIFNLFGCFGNILKLWFISDNKTAFIEYEKHKHARQITESTQLQSYFNHDTIISLCGESQVFEYLNQTPIEKIKFVKGCFKFYRFKDDTKNPIKRFTTILHFSNISNKLDLASLCKVIAELHTPIRIVQGQFKDCADESFIVEFQNLHESLEVLSLLHNRKVEGRKFNVEFTNINMNEIL